MDEARTHHDEARSIDPDMSDTGEEEARELDPEAAGGGSSHR
jgi:hypothetical protein